jgi:Transglycosylase SLT domain
MHALIAFSTLIWKKSWRFPSWILIGSLLFVYQSAHADVWGFVDERGVAHFANEKLDDRYEVFYKGGESFDTTKVSPGVNDTLRAVSVPTVPAKLLAFFDVSPSYKVVKHHLREWSNTYKIDYELLQALIATESGFDSGAVSPKGAIGLMQIMPDTARRYGVATDKKLTVEKKLFDPKVNIKTGTRYLRDLINMFPGRLDLALASYNAGEGAVQKAGNNIPNYKETQNYVKTVMQLYSGLKPPAAISEQRFPTRIRMEMLGGAARRGTMLAPLPPAAGQSAAQGAFANTIPGSSLATQPIPSTIE